DPRLQGLAQHAVTSVLHSPTDPAAAIVAMNPKTGAVKAMVNYLPSGRTMQFNLATQAHRSTGSSFKPITLATALSQGVSLYSTFYGPPELFITDPACATNNGPWDVHNFADEAAGTMNLLDATANSVNTIFAQLISRVGAANVAAQLTYALQGVVQHGTGTAAALGSRPVAGKTGTAENFQDAWFCGYVPQLATCVWVGYPKGEISLYNIEGVGAVAGGTLPAEIWHAFMGPAVGNLPVKNFPTP